MQDIKNIEWNIGAVIATAISAFFIAAQVYFVGKHLIGLKLLGALF
jgi:hypothetical protein